MSNARSDTTPVFDTLRERDAALEALWAELTDIPMDPETECIEAPFMDWLAGTEREEIWHWFDARHSKGVAFLLYGATAKSSDTEPAAQTRLPLPSGDVLIAEAFPGSGYPSITVFLEHEGIRTVVGFAEWNPDKLAGRELCIGAYNAEEDDTAYYGSYFGGPPDTGVSL